eukprot:gene18124-36906_t
MAARFLLRNASHILPVSEDLAYHLRKMAPKNNYTVVSNVVDEHIFDVNKISNQKSRQFIHISNAVESAKNILGIINVIFKISQKRTDFHLEIISDGDYNYAENHAKNLGVLNKFVFFKGTQTTEEIADALKNSVALVIFSNYENFPCVIPEAWMSGIPVIATSVNGIPEYVNNSNGILVQKNDEIALEKAMGKILDGQVKFNSLEIRTFAEQNFSYEYVAQNENLFISAEYAFGAILPEYQFVNSIVEKNIQQIEISILKKTYGTNFWQRKYNYPQFGFSVFASTLGNKKILGDEFALFPFVQFSSHPTRKFHIENKIGLGLGFATKRFDLQENYENIA